MVYEGGYETEFTSVSFTIVEETNSITAKGTQLKMPGECLRTFSAKVSNRHPLVVLPSFGG
jgi:hypothetical protein